MKIDINGEEKEIGSNETSYEQIVPTISYEKIIRLIGGNPNDIYSIICSYENNGYRKDSLIYPGQILKLEKNMRISAYTTGDA